MSSTGRSFVGRVGKHVFKASSARRAGPSSLHASSPQCSSSTSEQQQQRRAFSSSSRRSVAVSEPPALRLPTLAGKSPSLYQAMRPVPRSAYVALAYRLKLIARETDEEVKEQRIGLLIRACTHPSFASLAMRIRSMEGMQSELEDVSGTGKGVVRAGSAARQNGNKKGKAVEEESLRALDAQYIHVSPDFHNGSMAALGNSLVGLIASEYLHLRYPNLPNRVLKAALSAYVGPNTLSDVAAELGVAAQGMVRWDRSSAAAADSDPKKRLMSREAFADAMRSIIALIFQEQGLSSARDFVHAQLLSRLIPIVELLKFENPKRGLSGLMKKLGKERPQSRMIAESGRLSINPIFVVGVWSGTEKLGEGTGSAIRMAEFRAAEDALRRFYLSETPATHISLPSITLDADLPSTRGEQETLEQAAFAFRDVWSVDKPLSAAAEEAFQPSRLGESEVIFGSKA